LLGPEPHNRGTAALDCGRLRPFPFEETPMRQRLFAIAVTAALCGYATLTAETPPGFEPLFNGKDLSGWKVHNGRMGAWGAEDGLLFTSGQNGGWLMTEKEYADFEVRLEYRVPANGNSGVALRAPLEGDPAYKGMEIQILDDEGDQYKKLRPTQYTGSIYDVVPPSKRVTKPAGEWNRMRITAKGRQITVEVNGTKIVDANLDEYTEQHAKKHPGLLRERGHLGLQSHGHRTDFRNLYVKVL
jgi:hypothetical protein